MVQNICNGGEKQWIFNECHASMLYDSSKTKSLTREKMVLIFPCMYFTPILQEFGPMGIKLEMSCNIVAIVSR